MDTNTYSGSSESTEEEEEYATKKRVVFVGGSQTGYYGAGGDSASSSRRAVMVRCQAQGCDVDLNNGKMYHRRHKVCEVHAKSEAVIVAGLRQRFCQQCSKFHPLSDFDFTKRSCRSRLAGHNERRRKNLTGSPQEGSSAHRRFDYLEQKLCGT